MESIYKLILNHITHGEFSLNIKHPDKFEEYKQMAHLFLNHKGKHLFEEDILSQYREGMTLEKLFKQEQERFIQGTNHKKNGKNQKTWYDLSSMEEIERKDNFFDYFFACKLRHINILEIDGFLTFHLDYSFNEEKRDYFRFLNLVLRKYHEQLLDAKITDTVREWIAATEKEETLSGTALAKTKGKIKRERDDKITQLNMEQTALLIYCLRHNKIILKDEYLNDKEAGYAFSILTGYSSETIRQNLNKKEITRLSTKKNVEILLRSLKDVQRYIENQIKPEG